MKDDEFKRRKSDYEDESFSLLDTKFVKVVQFIIVIVTIFVTLQVTVFNLIPRVEKTEDQIESMEKDLICTNLTQEKLKEQTNQIYEMVKEIRTDLKRK